VRSNASNYSRTLLTASKQHYSVARQLRSLQSVFMRFELLLQIRFRSATTLR
jgi:hypothetical protein